MFVNIMPGASYVVILSSLMCCIAWCNGQHDNAVVIHTDFRETDDPDKTHVVSEYDTKQVSNFVPTTEWAIVKPGQGVPRGVHIRMNFETGLNEAKLLDGNDNVDNTINNDDNINYWKNDGKKDMLNTERKYFVNSEVEKALKQFKNDDQQSETGVANEVPVVPSKFRSYDELKKDFADMNLTPRTDLEIIKDYMTELKDIDNTSDQRQLAILDELEYYLHQIDNAQNFADLGGFQLVKPMLNNSKSDFRNAVGLLFGAACQSNPKVQVSAVEAGVLNELMRRFVDEDNLKVRRRFLLAISSIVRAFPFAQQKFVHSGGIELLTELLASGPSLVEVVANGKEKMKAIILVSDLLLERHNLEQTVHDLYFPDANRIDLMQVDVNIILDDQEKLKTKIQQYKAVPLMHLLVQNKWCSLVPRLLQIDDLDSQEKIITLIKLMQRSCLNEFKMQKEYFDKLRNNLEEKLKLDSDNDFIDDLLRTISSVMKSIFTL